jgi:hypothetical protein
MVDFILIRRALAGATLVVLSCVFAASCEKRAKPEECDTWRGQGFELKNKAQPCATDVDCQQSDWPPCESPVSKKTNEAIAPLKKQWDEGKCEDTMEEERKAKNRPKQECRTPPEVYCKQGLCVHREVGKPELQEQDIKIQ